MGKEIEYKAIDLGLPSGLLWADKNIGAEAEEDAGLYFQWGDTVGYTKEQVGIDKKYNVENYKFNKDYYYGRNYGYKNPSLNFHMIQKYNGIDKIKRLEPIDDAATQIIGLDWKIPTKEDFIELATNTDVYSISLNGENESKVNYYYGYKTDGSFSFPKAEAIKGMKFYNKNDHSKYIFIPASGWAGLNPFNKREDSNGKTFWHSVNYEQVNGLLWSSSISNTNDTEAWIFHFQCHYGYGCIYTDYRIIGLPIRGAKSK